MNDCLFCKIINGQIPSDVVYQDEKIFAFRDINPAGPSHILFVPKKHYATLNDVPAGEIGIIGDIIKLIQQTAKKEGIDQSGYRVVTNVNSDAGQEVFHLHVHMIGGKKLGKMG